MKPLISILTLTLIISCDINVSNECECTKSNSYLVYKDSIYTVYHKSNDKGVGSISYYVIFNNIGACKVLHKKYPYTFFYKGTIFYCDYFNGDISKNGFKIIVYYKNNRKTFRKDTQHSFCNLKEGIYFNDKFHCELSAISSYEDLPVGNYVVAPPGILYLNKEPISERFIEK